MLGEAFAQPAPASRSGVELRMAGHAGVGRRDAGDRRRFDAGVAIAAIEPEAADMMLVAERDRLVERQRGRSCIRRRKTNRQGRSRGTARRGWRLRRCGRLCRHRAGKMRHRPLSVPTVAKEAAERAFQAEPVEQRNLELLVPAAFNGGRQAAIYFLRRKKSLPASSGRDCLS